MNPADSPNSSAASAADPQALLDRVRIVLCRTSHPGNIGAAARAMKTMGLSRLALVAPLCEVDAVAEARAAGATDVLAQAARCATLTEALAGCVQAVALSARPRDLGPAAVSVRDAVPALLALAAQLGGEGEVALVFGNETSGLANDELQQCQQAVTIPSNPAFSSLNLGAAVQVMCYELRMAAYAGLPPAPTTPATPFSSAPASIDEVERFYAHLERTLTATGFHDPARPRRLLPKLRRLFGRAALEKDEINILRGILDSIEKPTGPRWRGTADAGGNDGAQNAAGEGCAGGTDAGAMPPGK
jgi:tRNA/rRNA methyltransferase